MIGVAINKLWKPDKIFIDEIDFLDYGDGLQQNFQNNYVDSHHIIEKFECVTYYFYQNALLIFSKLLVNFFK